MLSTKQKILVAVVVISTLGVLASVLALISSMPDLPRTLITDEICLPDSSGSLRCGKTSKRLLQYTQSVSGFYLSRDVRKPVFGVSDQVRQTGLYKLRKELEA